MKLRSFTFTLMFVLTVLASATPVTAQRMSGSVPDAITARELSDYAAVLDLSDQQRLAIDEFHDAYTSAFADLREREIEPFVEQQSGFMRRGRMGSPDEIDEAIKGLDQLMKKIRSLDERLFDQVATVLSEDQAGQLPRARKRRERERYRSGLGRFAGSMNPAVRVDIGQIVDELELSQPERSAIDPALATYESSLTAAMRSVHDSTLDLGKQAAERLSEVSFQDGEDDRQQRRQMVAQMRTVWADVAGQLMEQTEQISQLNRRTVNRMTPLLPEPRGRALHTRFYQQAYGESSVGRNPAARRLIRALELDELTSDQRAAIVELKDGYYAESDRITDREAALIEEHRKSNRPFFFGFDENARETFREQLTAHHEQRAALNERTIDALAALLGPELVDVIGDAADDDEAVAAADVDVRIGRGGRSGAQRATEIQRETLEQIDAAGNDPFLPGPISSTELDGYMTRLGLEGGMAEVVLTMHDDYMEVFRALQNGDLQRLRDARQAIRRDDADDPTEADIDRIYGLRRTALSGITAADTSLLDNLASLIGDEKTVAMERVRLARQRVTYNRSGDGELEGRGRRGRRGPWGRDDSRESRIDLAEVFAETDLEATAEIDAAMLDYERAVTGVFRETYETALRLQHAIDRMTARARQEPRDEQRRGPREGWREIMEGDGRTARSNREKIVGLNRSGLEQVGGLLDSPDATALRRAYQRRAFPSVFEDPHDAAPALAATLELGSLTFEQRSAVVELSGEYHGVLDGFLNGMIAVQTRRRDDENGRRNWQARMEQRREMEDLRAQRDDLNEKTLVRLRAVLNADQLRSIGLDSGT